MKNLILVVISVLLSAPVNALCSSDVWNPHKTIVGSAFKIMVNTPQGAKIVQIQFYGIQKYNESFEFGICKVYNSAYLVAVMAAPFTKRKALQALRGVYLDHSQPRIKGPCSESRNLINRHASRLFNKLRSKVVSSPAVYKKYFERLIKSHYPNLTTIKWVLVKEKQPPSVKAGKKAYNLGFYDLAVRIWQPLAKKGNAQAQYHLGNMYRRAKGVHRDTQRAFSWYTKSANQGLSLAQYELGSMYHIGYGVQKNEKIAAYWYLKAARQGNVVAQNTLASMYHFGLGLEKDYVKAKYWWSKAAARGYKPAQINLVRSTAALHRIIAIKIGYLFAYAKLGIQKIIRRFASVFQLSEAGNIECKAFDWSHQIGC